MREHILKFETSDDWKPMTEAACWTECPFACLTKLSHECRAREAYRKDGLVICPVVRFSGEFQWSGRHMTCEEAARLINPDTCTEALEEYKRHGEEVAFKAMEEALGLACKALEFMGNYNTKNNAKEY